VSGPNPYYPTVDYTGSSNPQCGLARVQPAIGTVMHTTSGTNSRAILQGLEPGAGGLVSVHTLIERTGQRDILYTPDKVCFHTGQTWYPGPITGRCDPANEVFLGIELECLDNQAPTYQQIDSAAEQIALWALQLGWRWPYNLFGHNALAIPLGRREDPVRFNWGSFAGRLYYWSRLYAVGGV